MTFSEKLTGLRRKSGMSQEQLADRLGVTRQSVSKWEGGTAMPELVKLISLSELFGVSVDYLVKDWMEEPDNPCGGSGEISSKQADRLEKKVDELTNYVKGRVYRYDSKTRIFGLPLVSIRFGFVRNGKLSMDNTAKGIIAIGNCAIGVVAIGIVGVGLFTFGVLAMGMLSLGIVAGGLAAFGVAALGYLALGVSAVGVYAGGVAAIAAKIAVAVSAVAPTAVGEFASGSHVLLGGDGLTAPEVQTFLLEHHPDLWRPLLRLLTEIGANNNKIAAQSHAGEQTWSMFARRHTALLGISGGGQSVHLSKAPGVRRWGILGLSQDLLPDICKGRVLALIPEL